MAPPTATPGRLDVPESDNSGVERRDPLLDPAWDAGVSGLPGGSFFHTAAWARVLQDAYGHVPVYLCRFDSPERRLRALLPLMEVSSSWTGVRGVALPFTDLCAPLAGVEGDFGLLFSQALACGRLRHWRYLELRGRPALGHGDEGPPPFPAEAAPGTAFPSLSFHGHVLDLHPDVPALFAGLAAATRRAVRKASQAGLRMEFSSTMGALEGYFKLHVRTRRRHGVPPQPWQFFECIGRHVLAAGKGRVATAFFGDRPIASAVFFHHGGRAIFKFGASDYAQQQLRANTLLMWESIKDYALGGFDSLHLGRTSLWNEGLRRFKLGFGAREERIEYWRFDLDRGGFVADTDRARGWFNPVLRCLPLPLLRLAGIWLYPHLS